MRRLERSLRARLSLLRPAGPGLLPVRSPLLRLEYPAPGSSRILLVFMPGIGDLAEDFERMGLVDALRRQDVDVDAVAVDAHYGYYASRVLFDRLTEDVLHAAESAGYSHTWLVGISMGGFGAACYAALHARRLSGLFLLAPWPGERKLVAEIAGAGGLQAWEPGEVAQHDFQRLTWRWLREHTQAAGGTPAIWLGYGSEDAFAPGNRLLATSLPQGQVLVRRGGHDWMTWKHLWHDFLERRPFDGLL